MPNLSDIVLENIGQQCLNAFNKLCKTGKPTENEWTVLSCILKYDSMNESFEVVSLGTGSKCIGASKMSPTGDILNDSHAEVFARRGFLLYLYDNIDKAASNRESIFVQENERFKLKDDLEFIFYSSQLPCGDASIVPKNEDNDFGEVLQSKKREASIDNCDTKIKKQKTVNDVHRTGAKCLPYCEQDLKGTGPGMEYHLLGQVRTKPGRGDRTLSVSCSDKIAKWIHLGIQGRLLDMLLVHPIYINHFIFGSGVPFSEESIKRAFLYRNLKTPMLKEFVPKVYQTSVSFPFIKNEKRVKPAAGSIIWIKTDNTIHEIAVQGKKLGVTKKKAASIGSALCISKCNIYKRFRQLLHKHEKLKVIISDNAADIPYNKMKAKAKRYEENWQFVKNNFYKTWTIKPDIWNFCVDVT